MEYVKLQMDPSGDIALIGDKPKFYQTFINFLNEKFKTEDSISTTFKDPLFRTNLVSKNLDARTIAEIAPYPCAVLNNACTS